ncbi:MULTISPECIES: ABC transporter permease [Actinomadura]|uniref:Transport permease protein n=1 Tax=Actinomadura yumaensis TaxID=111807 RepID=A0ABW2D0D2_9ACTN|nr:ABC transporter permease [Actinomadura sp. J1-007]MWK39171.1 ABC transporter permease [Actinomadura sp. J1-007]
MSGRQRAGAATRAPDTEVGPAELAARYGLTVSGSRPGPAVYGRRLWSRRHFIAAFATARLNAMHTGARLGGLWQVITPLLNAAVYYLVFGLLLGTRHGTHGFVPFLCTGVFVFGFTQSAVLAGTRAVQGNLALIRALHFPRACLPLASTLLQLQQLLFSMAVLMVIVVASGEPVTARWLLVVPVLAAQSAFNAGLAMAVARIGARETDAAQLMPFAMRTWMYASGVFYDLRGLTEHAPGWAAALLNANPALLFIDLMRYALMDSVPRSGLPAHAWPLVLAWTAAVGAGGYLFFWQAEKEYGRG